MHRRVKLLLRSQLANRFDRVICPPNKATRQGRARPGDRFGHFQLQYQQGIGPSADDGAMPGL